jgi:hypothetical protein
MANRRQFIAGVAAASAAAAPLAAAAPARAGEARPYRFIVDTRFAEARAAAALSVAPVERLADGDVTGFWSRELEPLWRTRPVVISGVTTAETLACLELLASRCRARVTARQDRGGLTHWTIAPIRAAPG